jgi:hypothetical protein
LLVSYVTPQTPSKSTASQCESAVPIEGLPNFVDLAIWTPRDGICDPAVDFRFMPAGPVGADFELSREGAFGDLAVDSGPGEPGPSEDGFQTYDTVWFAHGRAASCWLFLMASETRQDGPLQARKSILLKGVPWRSDGGKQDWSNSEATASTKVDAVR